MKIFEYGKENDRIALILECTAEPWWVFESSAVELGKTFHVFLSIADGHEGEGTEFTSIERYASDTISHLKQLGIRHLDLLYGCSMGGACAVRILACENIEVDKAIIDAGITPYPYPKFICRMIAAVDFVSIWLATRSMTVMKLAAPPEKWTSEGEDPKEHYQRIIEFERKHYSPKTIYNVFWSANNYSMPELPIKTDTKIEYWYGENEKKARSNDLKYVKKAFPQTKEKMMEGLEHAELLLMYPKKFCEEVMRFWGEE